MYIRACEILWVRASVTGSVGDVVDTQPLLWGAKEDVCVGNVLNEYSRLRNTQLSLDLRKTCFFPYED